MAAFDLLSGLLGATYSPDKSFKDVCTKKRRAFILLLLKPAALSTGLFRLLPIGHLTVVCDLRDTSH